MPVLAILLLLAGSLIAAVGFLGLRERLPRNRFFGVRTAASLRDEGSFRLANKIAGLPTVAGGSAGILAGLAALFMREPGAAIATAIIGLIGMLTITVAAGALGHRAALTMPEPVAQLPAGCGGCQCGNCPVVRTASS